MHCLTSKSSALSFFTRDSSPGGLTFGLAKVQRLDLASREPSTGLQHHGVHADLVGKPQKGIEQALQAILGYNTAVVIILL